MSVYIKGLEMPKEGFVEILIRDDGTVQQTGQSYQIDGTDYYTPYVGEMPAMYEAVPVQPHGRLIDADGEIGVNVTMMPGGKCRVDLIAPTIIPAEPFNNLSKPCKDDEDIPICTKASPASLGIYKKAEEREL